MTYASDPRTGVRIARILTVLAEGEDFQALSHIADHAGLPVSTVHRILEQLVELDLVQRGAHRQYGVGSEFSRIGALAAQKLDVVNLARPIMQRIVADCNETCIFGLYMANTRHMAMIEKVDSKYPLKYRIPMNIHRTLVWGATGHAILAWLPEVDLAAVLESAPPSPANPLKAPDAPAIREQLKAVRERGYAISVGQRTAGAVGIGVPIFRPGYRIVGDLCLTIPEFRFDRHLESRYVKLLTDGASKISRALGETEKKWR